MPLLEFGGARHPRLQCRPRLLRADRGHDAGAVEQEHGYPGDRLFPRLARSLPASSASRRPAAMSSSSLPRTALPPRPTPPPIAPPRPPKSTSPAAWRSKARPPRSASTSSTRTPCCAARRSGPANGRSSAPPPTRLIDGRLEEHYRERSMLNAQRLPGRYRRGDLLPRLRHVGQIDRQHHQCRCGQCPVVHALDTDERHDIDDRQQGRHSAATDNAARIADLKRDYEHLGEQLARRGIDIDAIKRKVAALRRRRPLLGRRHRRHALCPLSRRRRAARHLRQDRGLRRHPATDAGDADRLAAYPVGQGR